MGGMFGAGMEGDEPELSPVYILAIIETKNAINPQALLNPQVLQMGIPVTLQHKWGTTNLVQLPTLRAFPLVGNGDQPVLSPAKRFKQKSEAVHKGGTPSADALLELAEWALTHGLNAEFMKTINEVAQVDKENASAKAVLQIDGALATAAKDNPEVANWR